MPVTVEVETITPEQAAAVLRDHNPVNRPLADARVGLFAQALEQGEWQINGETIKFDWDGNLIDGQHRLAACERAAIDLPSFVVRGLPPEFQQTVDIGARRGMGDMLALSGYRNGNHMAAIGNMLKAYDEGKLGSPARDRGTFTEALEFVRKNDELLIVAVKNAHSMRQYIRTNHTAAGTAFAIFRRIDTEAAAQFWEMVRLGENLSGQHPALKLRNRLIKEISEPRRMRRNTFLATWIKAWNAYRTDTPLQVLHWKGFESEGFPKAI